MRAKKEQGPGSRQKSWADRESEREKTTTTHTTTGETGRQQDENVASDGPFVCIRPAAQKGDSMPMFTYLRSIRITRRLGPRAHHRCLQYKNAEALLKSE